MTRACRPVATLLVASVALLSASRAAAQCEAVFDLWNPSPPALSLVGDAADLGGFLVLTPNLTDQIGAVWADQPGNLRGGFDTLFSFTVSGSGGFGQGDGFAFVIQNDPNGENAIGDGGSGLGYANMGAALAVEFDTFEFPGEFPTDHVSVQGMDGGGILLSDDLYSLGHALLPFDINDGAEHWAYVRYRVGSLQVQVDGDLLMDAPVDLENLSGNSALDVDGCARVGFTAGTGGASSEHGIGNWSFGDTAGCQFMNYFDFISNQSLLSGDRLTVHMSPRGSGPWSFEWRLNDVPLVDGGPIHGASTPFLVIDPVGPQHRGRIDYFAMNSCSGVSTSFQLDVTIVCIGDLDGDGFVGPGDLGILLSAWETSGAGDLDGDGQTSSSDLGILLANWDSGCA